MTTRHDDIRDNNAFFVEILSTLKAIKSSFERSYDNLTQYNTRGNFIMRNLSNSPKARLINFI